MGRTDRTGKTMSWKLKFQAVLSGNPVSKGRPRVSRYGAYTPKKTRDYTDHHSEILKKQFTQDIIDEPIRLSVTFVSKRPKRLLTKKAPDSRIWKTTKPDIDNLLKMVMDIITKAEIWTDDNLIVSIQSEDYYCSKIEEPHTHIHIYTQTKDED